MKRLSAHPILHPRQQRPRSKVVAIRRKLARVDALQKAGKYKEGLKQAKLLEKAVKLIDYRPVQAEVLYWLGLLLERSGEYKEAESALLDVSHAAGESRDALLAAKAMTLLFGVVGCYQARYKEGLLLAHDAEVMIGVAGGNDRVLAQLRNRQGILYAKNGKYDTALGYFSQALAIQKKVLGPTHPDVALSLMNIGAIYFKKSDFDNALGNYRKSIGILEKTLGPEHPNMAPPMINMSDVFQKLGELDKALEYAQKALHISRKALGEEHPSVAIKLNIMGSVYWRRDDYSRALEYYQRAMQINEKVLGAQHPELARNLNNIGLVLWKQKKYTRAVHYLQRALLIWEQTLGKDHQNIAWPLFGLGEVYRSTGRLRQAQETFTRATEICKKVICSPEPEGMAYLGLAKVSWAREQDRECSLTLAHKARQVYAKTPMYKRELEAIDAWIKRIR